MRSGRSCAATAVTRRRCAAATNAAFVAHHEKRGRGAPCHYRGQRKDVARADVVLFAGGAALSDKPPEWTGRKLPARLAVVDPETGEIFPELTVTREDVLKLAATRRRRSIWCSSTSRSTRIRPTGSKSR